MSSRGMPVNTKPEETDGIRLRRASILPPLLRSYECHFNWTQNLPLSTAEMELALWVLAEKFHDEMREIKTLLKSCSLKLIAKKATQAFLHIEMKGFRSALKNLEEAEEFVTECLEQQIFFEEYAEGASYIFSGLRMLAELEGGDQLSNFSHKRVVRFSKLPAKAKIVVWVFRDYFMEDCTRAKVQSFDLMAKMLALEPCRIKWHFYMYKALRERRKCKPRRISRQSQEKSTITDPMSDSYICYLLADILNSAKEYQYPTRFGKIIIENRQQIIDMIRHLVMETLKDGFDVEGSYINMAEVYMSTLNELYRDYNLALACLEKALEINPNSTRAHHRMGIVQFKKREHKLAATHLREAIKDEENIGALYGLIQLLMSAPNKNAGEIVSLFKRSLTSGDLSRVWDKRCLQTLHYLKGCFHFMLDKEEEAITSWIIAHDNGSEKWSYYFSNLSYQSHRFGWPTKRLNLTSVSDTLKHVAYIEQTQFKQVLLDICLEVDDAIRRDHGNSWKTALKNKKSYF